MATPCCPKCSGTTFVEAEVIVSDHPCAVLQCDACGAVVGVLDFNMRDKIDSLLEKIKHRI